MKRRTNELEKFERDEMINKEPCPKCGSSEIHPYRCEEECCGAKIIWITCTDCWKSDEFEDCPVVQFAKGVETFVEAISAWDEMCTKAKETGKWPTWGMGQTREEWEKENA